MSRRLPWEIADARDVLAEASRNQADHEQEIRDAIKASARAAHLHRVALAAKIAELRDKGTAAALCGKLAAGDEGVSLMLVAADETEGDREVAVQEGWRLNANRKDSQMLADWSMRRDLAVDRGYVPEPEQFHDVSARRAV